MERGLEDVPDDLWHNALLPLLGLPDVLAARLASRHLRSAASKAISRLLAVNGRLPREAWDVFSAAVGVVVRLDNSDTGIRRALQTLAEELPGRLQRIGLLAWPRPSTGLCIINLSTAVGAFLHKAPQRPWAARLQQLRISDDMEFSPAVARAALADLPGLQELQITVRAEDADGSRSAGQRQALAQFPPALESLVLSSWRVFVDAAGLAATCPRLRKLQLLTRGSSRGLVNAASLSSLTCLQHLELDVTTCCPSDTNAKEQAVLHALLLAASQLPHLHTLKAPGAAVGPEEWQLLAGMPALQQAHLGWLGSLDAAALPAAGLVQLEVEDLHLESWEWEAGALAALLPELEELEISGGARSVLKLCTALQGHSRLRRLVHWPDFNDDGLAIDDGREATWPEGQPLRSMPQLQSVVICTDKWYCNMDGLLADAAGCAGLQELDISFGWDCYNHEMEGEPLEPFWATARGLAALAAGPCASTLRKLRLGQSNGFVEIEFVVTVPASSPADVALLLCGAFPRLQELSVEVRLGGVGRRPTGGSVASDCSDGAAEEASEAQVDACLARAAGAAAGSAAVPRWKQRAAADLVRALLQEGVQGLAGFGLGGDLSEREDADTSALVEGSVGRCKVQCTIWP
jgi:hypothetical protein